MCKKGEKMSENQLNVNGVNIPSQNFSANGVKMSILQQENKLLFDFLKGKGYKEDAIIYSTDVDKLVESNDTSGNNKLSIKEARAMGLEGSRKDVRSALKSLNEIKNSGYAVSDDEQYPVTVNNNETDFYNKDGVLLSNTKKLDGDGKLETFYLKGDKNLVDKTIETSPDKKLTVETTYENGDIEQPAETTINNNNDVTKIKYDWFEKNLNSKTTTHGDDVETIIYKNTQNGVVPKRIVSSLKSNPDSCKSIDNKYNDENKLENQTVEYSGAKISPKDKIIKEDIKLDPNTGKQTSNEITHTDGTKQYLQVFDGKPHEVGKDKDGNTFVVLDVPEGWSMSKIADEYGISRDDLLKANTNEKGEALYHTTNKGVEYFYINDKAVIPKPTKMPDDKNLKYSYTLPAEENNAKEVIPQEQQEKVVQKVENKEKETVNNTVHTKKQSTNPTVPQKQPVKPNNAPVQHNNKQTQTKEKANQPATPEKSVQTKQDKQIPAKQTEKPTKKPVVTDKKQTAPVAPPPKQVKKADNTSANKKTTNKPTYKKVKTPYNTVRQSRIVKAQKVNYEMKRDVPARVETAVKSADYRAFVTKSRMGYSRRLNDHNTKNTLCQVVRTENTTLPSIVLEYYSAKNPPADSTKTKEPEWSLQNTLNNPTPWLKKEEPVKHNTYDRDSVILDLKFLKEHIDSAKARGYDIPKALYEYIPQQNASEEVVKQQVQVYEAVFGRGSSGLLFGF